MDTAAIDFLLDVPALLSLDDVEELKDLDLFKCNVSSMMHLFVRNSINCSYVAMSLEDVLFSHSRFVVLSSLAVSK